MIRVRHLGAAAILALTLGCSADPDATESVPVEMPEATARADSERLDSSIEALRELLLTVAVGFCTTTSTSTTSTMHPKDPTIDDLLDALGLETVPPPTCTAAPEAAP